ncbi:WD repeat-containing protein 92 [Eumeta japonica]|uniref:WD repeat-containing protein 92 n=1 Tax=Eumeta variegata TaxID=151549 RepID=A0A4C1X4G1_EUMVA|nr:WD repeat-containing protein 92 [Eumeta japonica]
MDNNSKSGTIWLARHLPQNRDIFITCAGNGQVTLWKYEYPEQRSVVDSTGAAYGVAGKLRRLQRMVVSTQPINALDWNRDQAGLAIATAYDQYLRVLITTKLNLH